MGRRGRRPDADGDDLVLGKRKDPLKNNKPTQQKLSPSQGTSLLALHHAPGSEGKDSDQESSRKKKLERRRKRTVEDSESYPGPIST